MLTCISNYENYRNCINNCGFCKICKINHRDSAILLGGIMSGSLTYNIPKHV